MGERVPVLDVTSLRAGPAGAAASVVRAIAEACREWGFFQITGHGIPTAVFARLEAESRRFFALPPERKAAVRRDGENAWGYYDRELTKNVRDWKEVFDFGHVPRPDLPDDHPENRGVDGRNRWPDGLPGFRESLHETLAACEAAAFRLLAAVCAGLGAPPDRLDACFRPRHSSFLRLNHYPPCPDPAPADAPDAPTRGRLAVGRHSDAGALTLLWQSDVASLQVRRRGRWQLVPVIPDALVVNIGDMVQVWSNDRYRAPLHRVLANEGAERFSAPYFFNPSYETACEPLPELVDRERPARYRAVPWGEFRRLRAAGDYADLGEEIQIGHYRIS